MTIWMTTDADTSHKGFAATYTTGDKIEKTVFLSVFIVLP